MKQRIIVSLLVVFACSSNAMMQRSSSEPVLAGSVDYEAVLTGSVDSFIRLPKDKKKTKHSPPRDAFLSRLPKIESGNTIQLHQSYQSHEIVPQALSAEADMNLSDGDFINLVRENGSNVPNASAIKLRIKEIHTSLKLSTCTLDNAQRKWIIFKFAELYPSESPKQRLTKARSLSASVGDLPSMPKENTVQKVLDYLQEEEKPVLQPINELTESTDFVFLGSEIVQLVDKTDHEQSSIISPQKQELNQELPLSKDEVLTTNSLDQSPNGTLTTDMLKKTDLSQLEERLSHLPRVKKSQTSFLSPRKYIAIGAIAVIAGFVVKEIIKHRNKDNSSDTSKSS